LNKLFKHVHRYLFDTMIGSDGKPFRIIFRPSIPLDKELDMLMEMGRANTKAGLLIELVWLGINAKKEGDYGKDGQGMQGSSALFKS